jgi:hypothetical protein
MEVFSMIRYNVFSKMVSLLLGVIVLTSCSDDNAPQIDSIWLNVSSAPAVEVACAYPGQVLCLRGSNLSGVSALYVNDSQVNIDGSYIYATDATYTFTVPTDVKISEDYDLCNVRLVTGEGEVVFSPFIIKAKSSKPSITKVSATVLEAGTALTLTGKNLDGATEVWLPTVFDGRVECEIDSRTPPTKTSVTVIVPPKVTFTSGRAEIVMAKSEYVSNRKGRTFSESVYSETIAFSNK